MRSVKILIALLCLSAVSAVSAPVQAHPTTNTILPAISSSALVDALAGQLPEAIHELLGYVPWRMRSDASWHEPQWVMPHRGKWIALESYPIVGTAREEALYHTLESYRDLYWVRDRYKLRTQRLLELNPELDPSTLSIGDEVLVWKREPGHISQGIGEPNRGRLRFGELLPLAQKYVVLHRHRSFGTYYAVSEIKRVFDTFAQAFPLADPVMIGDLSYRTGRRIRPHLSHQTGRDVDITYPRLTPPPNYDRFHHISRRNLDARQTLWLVREFINSGMVEYIFMDRWVQRQVYAEAQRQGAPQEWLDEVFEYPGWGGKALVRRARGHDDHMHIRFFCQESDLRCQVDEIEAPAASMSDQKPG